jgi:hypothetical protein
MRFWEPVVAHAFGQRYELPISLTIFLLGGASVVFLTFLLVLQREVSGKPKYKKEEFSRRDFRWPWAIMSFVVLGLLIVCGLFGSQEIAENILPTLFWLVVWIAVPLSCGLIGDWTKPVNPFGNIVLLVNKASFRQKLLGRKHALKWPAWLSWWPATLLFFIIAAGELVYNQTATKPAVTAAALLVYFILSAFMGLLYGRVWLQRGEVFSVLFSTWGRLGYFRFGEPGKRSFAGGLEIPFEPVISRIFFVLLLLVSVSFDGLLSTPLWSRLQHSLPGSIELGSGAYMILATVIFALLALAMWLVFSGFASLVSRAGALGARTQTSLAGLLPSLVPISFGYLLAHNIEYLLVNGQLLLPLIGNPIGKDSWPVHLPHPFNDSYEVHIHLLPSSFFWYFAVIVIVAVHVVAVILAHRHLGSSTKNVRLAKRSEYPWIVAMVVYTMLSLWLLAQPLIKEKAAESYNKTATIQPIAIK